MYLVDNFLRGSIDPHIHPDPGSINVTDPTNPDPKHWMGQIRISSRSDYFVPVNK